MLPVAGVARVAVLFIVAALFPCSATAQALPPDPAEGESMQIGPFSFRPSLDVTNVGVDSNVFNDVENPKEDLSATFTPSVRIVVRGGPARVTYGSRVDYVWFQKYDTERSTNIRSDGRLEFRFTRMVPFVSGALADTRERPSAEIDLRARRRETWLGAGAAVLVGPAAVIAVAYRQEDTNYASDQMFRGVSLEQQLDDTLRAVDMDLRVDLTALTTLSLKWTVERQEFAFSPARDSRSIVFSPALEFHPSALISGLAMVGYRRFEPDDGLLAEFSGVIARLDLAYVLGASTRIGGRLTRDVHYSFDTDYPYYVMFGGEATVTQQIAGPLDIQAMAGRQQLRYSGYSAAPSRLLSVDTYGGGVGVRLGDRSRISVNVDVSKRRGDDRLPGRDYDRRRIFGSWKYGF